MLKSRMPQGLVLFAWYLAIKLLISGYPPALGGFITKEWWAFLASRALVLLAMAALLPMTLKREGLTPAALGWKSRWTARDFAWGLAGGAVIWFAHDRLLDWASVYAGRGLANTGQQDKAEFLRYSGPAEEFGIWLGTAVLSPLMEEVVYRAALIVSFRAKWGGGAKRDAAYVLASALLFAFGHELSHPLYTAVYAVTGAALGAVFVGAGSLNAAITAHAVINGVFCWRSFH